MGDGEMDFMKPPQIFVERTLAIVKPDAIEKAEEIEDIILRTGFTILQRRRVHLTPEQASDFYAEHYGMRFFCCCRCCNQYMYTVIHHHFNHFLTIPTHI